MRTRNLAICCVSILIIILLTNQTVLLYGQNYETKLNKRMIVFDCAGADFKTAKVLFDSGQLPNMKRISSKMILLHADDRVFNGTKTRAMTIPQHFILISGYTSEVTGTWGGKAGEFKRLPPGVSVFERIKSVDPSIHTMLITSSPFTFGAPLFPHVLQYLDHYQSANFRSYEVTKRAYDVVTVRQADSFFYWIHYRNPDYTGRVFGNPSEGYSKAMQECDKNIGVILDGLQQINKLDKVDIMVLSDHGFGDPVWSHLGGDPSRSHVYAYDTILVTNLNVGDITSTENINIAPTILDRFGIDHTSFEPPLQGTSIVR